MIDDIGFQIFTSAEEGALEQAIYDGVTAGRIGNASDLDALTQTIFSAYDIRSASEPNRMHL